MMIVPLKRGTYLLPGVYKKGKTKIKTTKVFFFFFDDLSNFKPVLSYCPCVARGKKMFTTYEIVMVYAAMFISIMRKSSFKKFYDCILYGH